MLIKKEIIYIFPPVSLTQACIAPRWAGGSNKELADWVLRLQATISECNNDKKLLRELKNG